MSEQADAGTVLTAAGETQQADAGTDPAVPGAEAESAPESETKTEEVKVEDKSVEYSFEVPDGVDLDEAQADEFKTVAKDLNLTNEAAQKVLDLAIKREQARAEAHVAMVKGWAEQVKADKELGVETNLAAARSAIEKFGSPALRDLLNSTGIGNHPEVVRFALQVGKAISEDVIVSGRSGGNVPPSDPAQVLYGSTTPKS